MRAMPSPTSSTRPVSRTSSWARYWVISAVKTEAISSGLNLMTAFLQELVADGLDLVADRGVELEVADPQHHPPEQVGLHPLDEDRLELHALAQPLVNVIALIGRQRDGRADEDADPAGPGVEQLGQ